MQIEELDLSVRTFNSLKRMGIDCVYELTAKTEEELMKPGILQVSSLMEITQKLASIGLSLGDPNENKKVYIVANTMHEDFFIHAATADKDLADAVYAKLADEYRGTDYEKDLELLEFNDKIALDLLNKEPRKAPIPEPKKPCAKFEFKMRRQENEQEFECILTKISDIKNGIVTVPTCNSQGHPVSGIESRDIFRDSHSSCSTVAVPRNDLVSIIIPEGVQWIGELAFESCYNLRCVSLPDSLRKIGRRAFSDCRKLESITIPDNVTIIESLAFFRCQSLTSIVIPPSVKRIGNRAFLNCKELLHVTIPEHCEIGASAFNGTKYAKQLKANAGEEASDDELLYDDSECDEDEYYFGEE